MRINYIINKDYIIKKKNKKRIKGKQDIFYYLSFDGFEKGNTVRDYFIILHEIHIILIIIIYFYYL